MIVLFLLAASDPAVAAPLLLSAPMTRVTVFADRAEVTRKTEVPCEGGAADASLPAIPQQTDERLIRVELAGDARLTSLRTEVVTRIVPPDPRKAALIEERDALLAKLQGTNDALRILDEREQTLSKLEDYFARVTSEEVRNTKPPLDQWKKAFDAMKAERQTSAQKRLALKAQQRAEARKLARLAGKLALLGPAERQVRLVSVAIACGEQKRVPLAYTYVLSGARWHPEYDLRVDADAESRGSAKAELSVSAIVEQSTGEDWGDVEIVLSTAQPALGAAALEPAPIVVDGAAQQQKKVLVQQQERRAAALEGGGTEGQGPAGAELDDGGRVFTFRLKQKPTVPSDGHPMWFAVDAVPLTVEITRVTMPALSPYVYRVAKQKNAAAYPLLAGTVHIFQKRAYTGDVETKYIAPGEPFEVSLGIEELMRVERRPVRELDRSPKLLGSTKAWERQYRVRLQNLSDKAMAVELREAIPLSKTRDVTVEIDPKQTTAGYQHDKERGFLAWRVQPDAKAEKAVDLAYTVRIPKEWQTP
jgi:uncharacterized protein (TIGR02231 family)